MWPDGQPSAKGVRVHGASPVSVETLSYDDMKRRAADKDPAVRAALAARPDTAPEVLYFLAEDPSPKVRRKVAANPATPPQADQKLALDPEYSVRVCVAGKMAGDGLADAERQRLWRMGSTIIETLLADQVVRVRRALAEAFQSVFGAPRELILKLAWDSEPEVAGPILRNSPVLDAEDLADLAGDDAPAWRQEAVAQRDTVPPVVVDAIVDGGNEAAVAAVLENPGAEIPETTFDRIMARAPQVESWHAPLVKRPSLAGRVIRQLAGFVRRGLLGDLLARSDIDAETVALVEAEAARRDTGADAPADPAQEALRLYRAGTLNEAAVSGAIERGDYPFVKFALALRAGLAPAVVQDILATRSGRSVTALVWKAGLSMRLAMEVQARLAGIAPHQILNARDGVDYPLTRGDMEERLALFGV